MFGFQGNQQALFYSGGLFLLAGYFLNRALQKQAQKHKKVKQDILKLKKQDNRKIMQSLTKPQNKDKKVSVAIDRVTAYTTNDTLLIRIREMPLHMGREHYFKHVTGGNFRFAYLDKQVIGQINDTQIISSILTETRQDVQIFNHMEPVVKKVLYFIKNKQTLSIVGALSYDFASRKFKIQPIIMGFNLSEMVDHFEVHYFTANLPRFFAFLMIAFGVSLLWKPMKKILRYIKSKIPYFQDKDQIKQKHEMQFIQKIKTNIDIKTPKKDAYQCVKCKKNVTNIIYKCGHLCLCEDCHEIRKVENEGKNVCPLCNSVSQHDLKIFFG